MKRFISFILTVTLCAVTCFAVGCSMQEKSGNYTPQIDTSITKTTTEQEEPEQEQEQEQETEQEVEHEQTITPTEKKYICPRCGEYEVYMKRDDYPYICGACFSLFVCINGEFEWIGNAT